LELALSVCPTDAQIQVRLDIPHADKVCDSLTDVKLVLGHARIRGGRKLQDVDLSPVNELQVLAGRGMRLSVGYMGRQTFKMISSTSNSCSHIQSVYQMVTREDLAMTMRIKSQGGKNHEVR
jgi:hypothetical protein